MSRCLPFLLCILTVAAGHGAPLFTTPPAVTVNPSGGYFIGFAVSETTDVEVCVVDTATGRVVRHLAAGVLGSNAPAPLANNTLAQQVSWDGTDDFGRALPNIPALKARVRAGLSVALDALVGENPYAFYRRIRGLVTDSTGAVYAFGSFPWLAHHGTANMALRKYGRNGVYEKTLWPPPTGLNPAGLTLFRFIALPGNKYHPKTDAMDAPQFGNSPLTYENSFLCSQLVNGKILVLDYPSLRYMFINPDGSPASTQFLVRSPAVPPTSAAGKFSGPMYLTVSPDQSYYLLSGCYRADSTAGGCFPSDTGFWRDGQVFKVIAATGAASPLITVPAGSLPQTESARRTALGPSPSGSVTYMAVFHGTAFDNAGHIFVCNRLNDEVGVYDLTGTRLGGLSVQDPDQVVVDSKTGAVYVLCRQFTYSFSNSYPPRSGTGTLRLIKFNSWQAASGKTMPLGKTLAAAQAAAVQDMEKSDWVTYARLNLALDNSGAKAVIWVNGAGGSNFCADSALTNIRAFEDQGDTLTLLHDFRPLTRKVCTGFDRIAVDPATEKVYVNNSWDEAYKVTDWSNPVLARCSTSTGPLRATDLAVSPDGFLYIHEGIYDGPVKRFTQDHLHAPANFAGRGTNVVVTSTHLGYGGGTQDKGIAVDYDGFVYTYNGSYLNAKLQKYDTTGALLKDAVVGLGCPFGGLKADPQGMIYLGALLRTAGQVIPAEYAAYWPCIYSTGSIVKFNPVTGGAFGNLTDQDPTARTVSGALKVYDTPVSPFSWNLHTAVYVPSARWNCVCRAPRFDVDAYGRLFAPHTVVGHVTVADNAGNEIVTFGEYGNIDDKGPGIPLCWPAGVAASEDYIYVTDLVNARLVRVKMNYALDNLVSGSQASGRLRESSLSLASAPLPFNPVSRVRLSLPAASRVRLEVADMSGKVVRVIFEGERPAGVHEWRWNALDESGRPVASGMYFYRVIAENTQLVSRTVYMR